VKTPLRETFVFPGKTGFFGPPTGAEPTAFWDQTLTDLSDRTVSSSERDWRHHARTCRGSKGAAHVSRVPKRGWPLPIDLDRPSGSWHSGRFADGPLPAISVASLFPSLGRFSDNSHYSCVSNSRTEVTAWPHTSRIKSVTLVSATPWCVLTNQCLLRLLT
jgi:hypothetical protein